METNTGIKSPEEILKENVDYGNPTSIQDWVHSDAWVFRDHVLRAMQVYANQFQSSSAGIKEVGEYQLCPKCHGDGNLARYNSPAIVSTDAALLCDVCKGAKVILRPTIDTLRVQEAKRCVELTGERDYYKKLADAGGELLKVMNVPENDGDHQWQVFRERNQAWQELKSNPPK